MTDINLLGRLPEWFATPDRLVWARVVLVALAAGVMWGVWLLWSAAVADEEVAPGSSPERGSAVQEVP